MKALRVEINDEVVKVAGFPRFGVVTCIISGVRKEAANTRDGADESGWDYEVDVAGLHHPDPEAREHVTWHRGNLEVGDVVVTRLVECDEADAPLEVSRETRQSERDAKRNHLARLREQVVDLERELGDAE